MGNCQNYGPFLGPYYNTEPNLGDPKRDHDFDNPPNSQCRQYSQTLGPNVGIICVLGFLGEPLGQGCRL